jgi:hypothetical protein
MTTIVSIALAAGVVLVILELILWQLDRIRRRR